MEIGGSQLNAIEIGEAVQALGHRVLLVAEDGQLSANAENAGLEHFRVSERRSRPSPGVMKSLTTLVRERNIDVVHGYEWPPAIDAWLGPHLRSQTPVVATVMSAVVAPFLPRSMPLVVGVEELRRKCLTQGFRSVSLIEPPVNVHANSPAWDGSAFRNRYQISADTILVVVVCRLARELKLEGLLAACRTIGKLAGEGARIRLAIVGDGPVRAEVTAAADRANAQIGSKSPIIMTGELSDPRTAYAAADIMLGMGGSALRGLAFGKPLVVQGERGFWKLCSPQSVAEFLESGWYGLGDGRSGDEALLAALKPVLASQELRTQLGAFGRKLIVDRFSLEHAANLQLHIYERAIALNSRPKALEVMRTAWGATQHKLQRRWRRTWGASPADDFNAVSQQLKR